MWIYQNITLQYYLPDIVLALECGNLRAIYKGPFDIRYGTMAWYIDGHRSIIRGVNVVSIGSNTINTIRYELAGIYNIIQIIKYMVHYFCLDKVVIEIGCDCEGGLKRTPLKTDKSPLNYIYGSHLDRINFITHIN